MTSFVVPQLSNDKSKKNKNKCKNILINNFTLYIIYYNYYIRSEKEVVVGGGGLVFKRGLLNIGRVVFHLP